ncbi:hypothetical protein [Bacteriophage sp.]|nr:hypothetical protein [Bacteriophage sp.]
MTLVRNPLLPKVQNDSGPFVVRLSLASRMTSTFEKFFSTNFSHFTLPSPPPSFSRCARIPLSGFHITLIHLRAPQGKNRGVGSEICRKKLFESAWSNDARVNDSSNYLMSQMILSL